MKRKILFLALVFIGTFVWNGMVSSVEALSLPSIQLGVDDVEEPEKVSSALQILLLLTVLTLAPSILILTTSFSRIIIVLSFLRQAMGSWPPTPAVDQAEHHRKGRGQGEGLTQPARFLCELRKLLELHHHS